MSYRCVFQSALASNGSPQEGVRTGASDASGVITDDRVLERETPVA